MYRSARLTVSLVFSLALFAGCASTAVAPKDGAKVAYTQPMHDQVPSGPTRADQVESSKVNTQLAAAYLQTGRIEAAKEVISRALAADPDSPLALAVQGLIYGESRDFARGDASFERALLLAPADPDLNHNYAMYLCRSDRTAKSISYFEKAAKAPGYPRAANSETALGACLLKLGRITDAEKNFKNVFATNPANPGVLVGLAEIALVRADLASARSLLSRYSTVALPSPRSLQLSIELERASGNRTEAAGLEADLLRLHPGSDEARAVTSRAPYPKK